MAAQRWLYELLETEERDKLLCLIGSPKCCEGLGYVICCALCQKKYNSEQRERVGDCSRGRGAGWGNGRLDGGAHKRELVIVVVQRGYNLPSIRSDFVVFGVVEESCTAFILRLGSQSGVVGADVTF